MSDTAVALVTEARSTHLRCVAGNGTGREPTDEERVTTGRSRWAVKGPIGGEIESDEPALIRAAQGGDIDAFTTLLERHRGRMQRLCISLTSNHDDAQDALQLAQIALWRKLGQFEGRSRFTTWLYQVVVNTTLGEQRRRRPEPIDPFTSEGASDTDTARQVTDVVAVRWALDRLPEPFRTTLVLSAFEGLSQAEIAEILIISEGTVKSRLSRARDTLHHLLSEAPS